jgi:hypothetical protein
MMKTKIFISLCASTSLVLLFTTATLALAASPYQSGFSHGVHDGKDSCLHPGCNWYILQPGKGFAFHTKQFNQGYVDGFCSVSRSGQGSDADEATFTCP